MWPFWYLLKLAVVLVARTEAMVGILRSQQLQITSSSVLL